MTSEEYSRILNPAAAYVDYIRDEDCGTRADRWRCKKCGKEFFMPEYTLPCFCPHCGHNLKRDLKTDVRVYANSLIAASYNGVFQECGGCERGKTGNVDTCMRCLHGKLTDAARVIFMLVEELDKSQEKPAGIV